MVHALLEACADYNKADCDGETPLFVAAENGHLLVVQTLLENGASVNTARNDGCTPPRGVQEVHW